MMKKIIYLSVLLVAAVGYSQDKVSAKSDTPIEAVIVKKQVSAGKSNQNKAIVKNDIVLEKQSAPVENRVVNYIGTPKTTYIEPVALAKKERP